MTRLDIPVKPSLNELVHFGVKGMKWGVRRDSPEGVSRGTNREARKDAREFVRAKLYYGEGAGTRRKLIKARVEGKAKKDPSYKKAFDFHVDRQDTSRHASKARGERKRKDIANSTRKTARGVTHILRGNPQYASAAAAIVVGGAVAAKRAGADKVILKAGKTAYNTVKNSNNIRAGMSASDFLRNLNL